MGGVAGAGFTPASARPPTGESGAFLRLVRPESVPDRGRTSRGTGRNRSPGSTRRGPRFRRAIRPPSRRPGRGATPTARPPGGRAGRQSRISDSSSSTMRGIRKCRRTRSRPLAPRARARGSSRNSVTMARAHSSTLSTSSPRSRPPSAAEFLRLFPPTTGVPFHNASATTSPNPSRIDFWITSLDNAWNALTSMLPTPTRFVNTCDVFVAADRPADGAVHVPALRIVRCHRSR